jgi:hypothetical protein
MAAGPATGAGEHLDLMVTDSVQHGFGIRFTPGSTIQGRYLQDGATGNWGAAATYDASTARYAAIAIDVTNSQFHLQTAPAGVDLTLDASWTTVSTLNFADESGFDITGYHPYADFYDSSGASTVILGEINPPGSGGTPTIALDDTTKNFTVAEGGSAPADQTVAVTNTGGGSLSVLSRSVTYIDGSGWISTSLGGATDAPATLTISIIPTGLTAGIYQATVHVSSTAVGVTNSPQDVLVTLTVTGTGSAVFGVDRRRRVVAACLT